ncbi:MAG: 50S ribosomal protein L3 [Deltaproteobacteria bacterium RBG_16_50_11]|nr:MAG: 50S ribosomal protein L3 [Deltaproteobacteria bacterium RBG_16_50_11]
MKRTLGIIGKKLGMTQLFLEDGSVVPVTVVEAGPCAIVQKKTNETDGYNALQLGFLPKNSKRVNKPLAGHFKKAGVGPYFHLKEFRLESVDGYELGQEVNATLFKPGDVVDVMGLSKGKGFAGVVKRHGFRGSPGSHGTHEYFRHGGSVGSATFPHHVFKGLRMPGHLGNQRVTLQNILVVDVKEDKNLILLRGGLPGSPNGWVLIRSAVKAKKGASPTA